MSAHCVSLSVRPARPASISKAFRPRALRAAAAARPQLHTRRRLQVAAAADSPPVDVSHLDEDISECPFGTGKRGAAGTGAAAAPVAAAAWRCSPPATCPATSLRARRFALLPQWAT